MAYQSINPYDGKIFKTFKEITDSQIETAIKTAATCYESWRQRSFAERAVVVAKVAAIMRARVDEFARPATREMGKLIEQARGEVLLSADIIDYYAKTPSVSWRQKISNQAGARPRSRAARSGCCLVSSRGTTPIINSCALQPLILWLAMSLW